jgi:lipopolysaccharide transport system ATP-binding protein
MQELVFSAKILVLASHDRKLIETLCTRAIWLEHGKIKMDGKVAEVSAAYFGE